MKTAQNHNRQAFTLIELLVVIAIVGIMVGLLLPAVQRVREAANRVSCHNNLKQIGLAVHHYHDAMGSFPAGYQCRAVIGQPTVTSPGWGWAALILPYIEQDRLLAELNLGMPVEAATNFEARTRIVKLFVCPSDRQTGQFTVLDEAGNPIGDAATNSYAANYGAGGEIADDPDNGNGLFYRNSRVRFADVRDGTSNTVAIGERAAYFTRSSWAGAFSGGTTRITRGAPVLGNSVEKAPTQTLAHTGSHTLNDENSDPDDFFTPHAGVGGFLFGDGSVRTIKWSVDLKVLQALSTRDGGEVVDPDRY